MLASAAVRRHRLRSSSLVGLASLLLWGSHLGYVVVHHLHGDARGLLLLGTNHPHPEALRGAALVSGHGYDGQFFAAMATDPFFSNPETVAAMDSPVYRGSRFGMPLLAWLLALGNARTAVFLYQFLCWLGAALLPWVLARWLEDEGASAFWGAPAALFAGVLSSLYGSLPDAAAITLGAAAVSRYVHRRPGTVTLLVMATLVKETSLFVAAPLAFTALRERRLRLAAEMVLVPLAPLLAWRLWLVAKVGGGPAGDGRENFGWPFTWVPAKLGQPLDPSEWATLAALFLAVAGVLVLSRDFLRWRAPETCYVAATLVAAFLTKHVYLPNWFNHSRVSIAVATFAVIVGESRRRAWERWVFRLVVMAWAVPTVLLIPEWVVGYAAILILAWFVQRGGPVARASTDARTA